MREGQKATSFFEPKIEFAYRKNKNEKHIFIFADTNDLTMIGLKGRGVRLYKMFCRTIERKLTSNL